MQLYFAYGSNMVPQQMAARCPRARLLGPAILPGHRFAIAASGFATVLPSAAGKVWGIVWHVTPPDEAALDRYEEIASGLYRRRRATVSLDGRPRASFLYVAVARAPGRARPGYLAEILAAAESFNFPEDYRRALAAA